MNSRSQCREMIMEKLLTDVRQQLNRLWDNDEDPVACQLRDRRGYILDSIFIPPLPEEDSQSQPKRDESLSDTVSAEDDDENDAVAIDLSPTEEAILRILEDASHPLKITQIAERAGRPYNSHFRAKVRRLVRKQRITAVDDSHYMRR